MLVPDTSNCSGSVLYYDTSQWYHYSNMNTGTCDVQSQMHVIMLHCLNSSWADTSLRGRVDFQLH